MAAFHIALVAVNDHFRMYEDLARVLAASLTDLGHRCSTGKNQYRDDATNILLGATIFASRHLQLADYLRGKPYIVYQLEQLDEVRGLLNDWPEYREILVRAAAIWDYGPSSTKFLTATGFPRVAHLPPGHHPCLEAFHSVPDPDFDIAFCGTAHPRRERVLQTLAAAGARVVSINDAYGTERNALLARAKIVLNIHAWDDLDALETVRLSLLLANRCFVISETGDHNPYGDGLVYADYAVLTETCIHYLKRPRADRDAIAVLGQKKVRSLAMADLLRLLLA